jgi:chemotaxis protein MotB
MRRQSWIAASLMTLLAIGCGIPKEKHQEALDQIKKLKAELAAERKAWDDTKNELTKKNKNLSGENSAMKQKLVDLGQDLSKLKTAAGQMVQDLSNKDKQISDLRKAQEAARKRAAMYQRLVASFKKMVDSGKLKVGIRNGRMVVQLSDKILFPSGKAKLKKDGKAALQDVTAILKAIPNRNFQVAGHTDNIPIKTRRFKSNWELSTARAVQVVKFMAANGMDPKRISAAGYAEHDPVGDNEKPDGRRQNRRIEITLMPSLNELPKIAGK